MELQIAKNDGLYKVLTLKFNEPLFFFTFVWVIWRRYEMLVFEREILI